MNAPQVAIVVDGRLVASSTPAILERGRVYAPVDPYAREIVASIACVDGCRYLVMKLNDRSIRVRIDVSASGQRFVPLARVARALGERVAFDSRTMTLAIDAGEPAAVATPTPYVYRTAPTIVETFTPYTVPTPIPTIVGIPRPRRTPILVEPQPSDGS